MCLVSLWFDCSSNARVSCFYMQDDKEISSKLLDYAFCLIHLVVFGILGVICTIYMHTPFSSVQFIYFLLINLFLSSKCNMLITYNAIMLVSFYKCVMFGFFGEEFWCKCIFALPDNIQIKGYNIQKKKKKKKKEKGSSLRVSL